MTIKLSTIYTEYTFKRRDGCVLFGSVSHPDLCAPSRAGLEGGSSRPEVTAINDLLLIDDQDFPTEVMSGLNDIKPRESLSISGKAPRLVDISPSTLGRSIRFANFRPSVGPFPTDH